MDKLQPANKIYVTIISGAAMASIDALLISLDRFKNMLSSDSARDQFETTLRSVKTSLKDVHAFVESVYANKDPRMAVNMKARALVVEIAQSEKDFYDCIQDQDVNEILACVNAVGSMPASLPPGQKTREYTVYPVKYSKGNFVKMLGTF